MQGEKNTTDCFHLRLAIAFPHQRRSTHMKSLPIPLLLTFFVFLRVLRDFVVRIRLKNDFCH